MGRRFRSYTARRDDLGAIHLGGQLVTVGSPVVIVHRPWMDEQPIMKAVIGRVGYIDRITPAGRVVYVVKAWRASPDYPIAFDTKSLRPATRDEVDAERMLELLES
jgi:hypothetical protein